MSGVDDPSLAPKLLCSFNSQETIQQYAKGCDEDIGGYSTMNLTLDESGPTPVGKFWGKMKLDVRPELQGKIRVGYAGFRSMVSHVMPLEHVSVSDDTCHNAIQHRKTLFGEMMHDLAFHEYLALRVRLRGTPALRNSYFVNIQTDGYVTTDLWQHRLYFKRDDGEWEDVYVSIFQVRPPLRAFVLQSIYSPRSDFNNQIPLKSFVLTNQGEVVTSQAEMLRERIRTVGISILGGTSGMEGSYELGIESIKAINPNHSTQMHCE